MVAAWFSTSVCSLERMVNKKERPLSGVLVYKKQVGSKLDLSCSFLMTFVSSWKSMSTSLMPPDLGLKVSPTGRGSVEPLMGSECSTSCL